MSTLWQTTLGQAVSEGKLPRPEPESEGSLTLWTVQHQKVYYPSDAIKELDFDKLTFADLMERDDD